MVKITNYSDNFYYPPNMDGLEEVVLFPDGEMKRENIPNSSVWLFDAANHKYQEDILSDDIGCGIAAFILSKVDYKEAADKIADYLKDKNVLGRGNHFIDICSTIQSIHREYKEHNVMVIHTDGKSFNKDIPKNVDEALNKIEMAEEFRETIGYNLTKVIGATAVEKMTDCTHNSVEIIDGKVIYRKGAIKTEPNKLLILPIHLGAMIFLYAIDENNLPLYLSMPHSTGRKGPIGETKVDISIADGLRKKVYIPKLVNSSSLRTEHPLCYNNCEKILRKFGKHIIPLGGIEILSYIGKI